jgi:hypothetical protein
MSTLNAMGMMMCTKDWLHVQNGLITGSNAKTLKEALNVVIVQVSAKAKVEDSLEHQEEALVHLIHMQEGPNPPLFRP